MPTNYRTDSMYRNTRIVNSKYLDIYKTSITNKEESETDTIKLESKYHQRPDKLAYDLYGNAKLWWIFAEFNQDSLVDPILDFTSGKTITYPIRFS